MSALPPADLPVLDDAAGPTASPPASMRPAAARPVRRSVWFGISGLATGALALGGLAIVMMSGPDPMPAPAIAAASPEPIAKPPSITVVNALVGPITESVVVTGNLIARDEILVASQIDGYAVEDILAEEGDQVQQGQVLARLSRSMVDAALAQNDAQLARSDAAIAQARSAISEAQASKDQAASAFTRTQMLRRDGISTTDTLEVREAAARTTSARLDSAEHALTVAEADRKLAEAQRRELMVRSERTEIKAPASGVVSRRTARIGAIATSSADPLFRIIKDGSIELEANVSESTLSRLTTGMPARVTTAGRKDPFTARVRLVSPEVDETTRLGRVRITIDPEPGLKLGAFGRASVEIASRDGVLVPQSAVLYSDRGPSVQIVKDGVVTTAPVEIGLRTEQRAEILKGVDAGASVVATAGTFVRNGDRVVAVPSTAE